MGRLEVDRQGLSKVLQKRGYSWICWELIQNALDEDISTVSVTITRRGNSSEITVEDDSPTGFRDLSHAWTMYAESYKKSADQRGRFNIGEKLVVALADYAEIVSTTGAVSFEGETRTVHPRTTRTKGTLVVVRIKTNKTQHQELLDGVKHVIVPSGVVLTCNGEVLPARKCVATFECTLPTEIPGEDGILRPTQRKTAVELYEPLAGEDPSIYEMGIPVVDIGDRFHVNIMQRVPLTQDRDNVRPAYLKAVRAFVLENTYSRLEKEEFTKPWVAQAVTDSRVGAKALESYLGAKYGEKRVVHDPSSAESTSKAQAAGYHVVSGRSEAKETWERIREAGLIPPASAEFPIKSEDVGVMLADDELTSGMRNICEYSRKVAQVLLGRAISVQISRNPGSRIMACYGHGNLTYNAGRLGDQWFDQGPSVEVNDLLLHELGHEYEGNHLSSAYYQALSKLGAKLTELALKNPALFASHRPH